MCCGVFEHEDTRAEAIISAAACMNSDSHKVLGVEGPNGEDLMTEALEESDRRSDEWLKKSQETRQSFLGYVEVKGPTGKWWGREAVYSIEQRDEELAVMRRIYGEDRVQFVDRPESKPYESMGTSGR